MSVFFSLADFLESVTSELLISPEDTGERRKMVRYRKERE